MSGEERIHHDRQDTAQAELMRGNPRPFGSEVLTRLALDPSLRQVTDALSDHLEGMFTTHDPDRYADGIEK